MLQTFGIRNFFCFKEGIELDMSYGPRCPEKEDGYEHSNVMCVKGANASGKTNFLKAISFLKFLTVDAFSELKPDEKIPLLPFFGSKEYTEIYCTFKINQLNFEYDICLNMDIIVQEKLVCTNENSYSECIFERKEDKLTECHEDYSDLKSIPKIRKNISIISNAFFS